VPALYAEGLALAVLGALGGPARVAIRPPVALDGGGEVVATADELDAVLRAIIEPPADGEMYGADEMGERGPAAPSHAGGADAAAKRARALVEQARFWGEGGSAAAGLLVVEEVVSGVRLPRDDRKGWFDPTQRAYVVAAAGEVSVLGGACRFPSQPLSAAAGSSAHAQHAPEAAHRATALGESMARAAFEPRLPLGAALASLRRLRLRELITHCLSADAPTLHLAALALLGGTTAGSHAVGRDPEALRVATYEFFGRPFAPNFTLWPEHPPLLLALTAKPYREAHGAPVARLVQRRLLRDVVARDFLAVAANALRGADAAVVGVQLALEASPYNGVAAEARQLRQAVHQMARSGEQRDGVAVANKASIGELAALLDQ